MDPTTSKRIAEARRPGLARLLASAENAALRAEVEGKPADVLQARAARYRAELERLEQGQQMEIWPTAEAHGQEEGRREAEQETLGWAAELLDAEADGATAEQVRALIKARILELPREGYRKGERAALDWVAEHVLLLPPDPVGDTDTQRSEIELAVEALRAAAPGPGPGDGEAELRQELEQARTEIKSLESGLREAIRDTREVAEQLAGAKEEAARLGRLDGSGFLFRKRVKMGKGPSATSVMSTRARFDEWSTSFELLLMTGLDVEEGHIEAALKYGGAVIGLGDWHSRYGLFTVELFK